MTGLHLAGFIVSIVWCFPGFKLQSSKLISIEGFFPIFFIHRKKTLLESSTNVNKWSCRLTATSSCCFLRVLKYWSSFLFSCGVSSLENYGAGKTLWKRWHHERCHRRWYIAQVNGCREWQFFRRLNLVLSISREVSSCELGEPHKTTIITLKVADSINVDGLFRTLQMQQSLLDQGILIAVNKTARRQNLLVYGANGRS